MISVALIGADGAGKSTVAAHLASSFPRPLRVLYMGVSGDSANVTLPWNRRLRRGRGSAGPVPTARRGFLRSALGLANQIADEWYRALISWGLRRRGFVVVYDRHFLFDFDYRPGSARTWRDRLHRWMLARFYPRPDLVLFLDAPAEVLFARKGEFDLAWLDARRQALLKAAQSCRDFAVVDATQPLTEVCSRMEALIEEGCCARGAARKPAQAPVSVTQEVR